MFFIVFDFSLPLKGSIIDLYTLLLYFLLLNGEFFLDFDIPIPSPAKQQQGLVLDLPAMDLLLRSHPL